MSIDNELLVLVLTQYYADEYSRNSTIADSLPDHFFSTRFEARMKKIIKASDRIYVSVSRRRVRLAAIVAAAIIMILASAVITVAIVRPEIFYKIKERTIDYVVEFIQEKPERSTSDTIIKPEAPEGYHLTEENSDLGYTAVYMDDDGHRIVFDQMTPEDYILYMDSEQHDAEETFLNGYRAIISKGDESNIIVIENGEFVFVIDGLCDYETIYQMAMEIVTR